MSASAPKTQPSNPGEREKSKAPWLGLSVLFHALVLAWMIYLVPPRQLVSPSGEAAPGQSPAAASASPELVEEVSKQIELGQAGEMRNKVEELLATEKMLEELGDQKAMEFSSMAGELATVAAEVATKAEVTAGEAQAQALQAQAEALSLTAELDKLKQATPAEPPPPAEAGREAELKNKIAEAQEKAKAAQSTATSAQSTATQQLGFREDPAFKDAKTTLKEALAAQEEANRAQDDASIKLNELSGQQRQAKIGADAAKQARRQADSLQIRAEELKRSIATQEENYQQQQTRLENLRQKTNPTPAETNTANKIAEGMTASKARLDKTKAELESNLAKTPDALAKASKAAAEAEKLGTTAAEATSVILSAQQKAIEAQQKASTAQTKAQTALAKAGGAATENPSTPPSPSKSPENTSTVSLDGKSFAELYATAVETEKNITENFQNIRATQVAVQRKIPVSEALKYVEIATPTRAGFEGSQDGKITDAGKLEKQNASMENAMQQVDSMLALARNMAFQATNSGGNSSSPEGTTLSAASLRDLAAQNSLLTGLATEVEGQTAVDLTAIMKQIENGDVPSSLAVDGSGQGDGAGKGSGQDQGSSGASAQGSGALAGQGGTQGSGSGAAGQAAGYGRGGSYGGPGVQGFPGMGAVSDSVPGRKVHASAFGSGSKWMFVDSWYIIGPFPNPQRRNIDTKFPPESVVDLDANYLVEGERLKWQFVQTSKAAIHPPLERPYAIYYGYTTLWFDEPRDLWIATGSDDFSKIWINDILVWASGPVQKIWKPDEGYRKVHFKKGLNRVLFRLENGHHACMISFMLNMHEDKP